MHTDLIYGQSAEFILNRAVETIHAAQQQHRRALESRDETIQTLERKIEALHTDNIRKMEKVTSRNHELMARCQLLEQKFDSDLSEKKEFEVELARLRQELSECKDKLTNSEAEKAKAHHIIRNLIQRTSPLSHAANQHSPNTHLNNRTGVSL